MKPMVQPSPGHELSLETMFAFLQNELGESEAAEVEHIIQNNPLYAKAIENLSIELAETPPEQQADLLRQAEQREAEFIESVRQLGEKKPLNESKPAFPLWKIAAVVLLLLLPLGYFLSRPPVEIRLQQEYFQALNPDMLRGNVRGGGEAGQSKWETELSQVMGYYQQAGSDRISPDESKAYYQAAIKGFQQIVDQPTLQVPAHVLLPAQLYLGVSYLLVEAPEQALTPLQAVIDDNDNHYLSQAQWYKAWSFLQLGKKEQAVAEFQQLAATPNAHQTDAAEIVEQLQ
jgi:tetratricopeptide (TPR) repeat protein